MVVNPLTLDYIDGQTIRELQVKAIQTIKESTKSSNIRDKKKKKQKEFNEKKQESLGKELVLIFKKLGLKFEYTIGNYKIIIRLYDNLNKTLVEDEIEDLEHLVRSIKNEKGKIIDLKI